MIPDGDIDALKVAGFDRVFTPGSDTRDVVQFSSGSTRRVSSFFPPPGTGITIVEVGPRDGLQNEPEKLTVQTRVKFVRSLAAAGLKRIEAASFVHPKWIPSMAGAAEVMAGLRDLQGIQLSVFDA